MRARVFTLFLFATLAPALAGAREQASTASEPPPSTEAEEPLPPKPDPSSIREEEGRPITLEEWEGNDWMLVKPRTVRFEIGGYYRLRGDLFYRLHLDNEPILDGDTPRYERPLDGKNNLTGTNMRLRLDPRINVTDRMQVLFTLDVFDNLVLGSSARGYGYGGGSDDFLGYGQDPVVRDHNSLRDPIVLKRAYVRLATDNEQLELRAGRMPDHWGLGMMVNDGDCLDCDYGDVVDRIAVALKVGGHVFAGMYDWAATGPARAPYDLPGTQQIETLSKDDVNRFGLRIARVDHPDEILDRVTRGETVLNYGWWNSLQTQDLGLDPRFYEGYDGDGAPGPLTDANGNAVVDANGDPVLPQERRDGFLYLTDAFARLYAGRLELAAEAAFQWGSFRDPVFEAPDEDGDGIPDALRPKTRIYKLGGVLDLSYRLHDHETGTRFRLRAGGASGDSAPGFGALRLAGSQRGGDDHGLTNFQFSPDYHVDLLLFRRLIGTVTDAWFVQPGLDYRFSPKLLGSLSATYAQAIFKRSTPSGRIEGSNELSGEGKLPLGVEVDVALRYGAKLGREGDALQGSIAYGFLFPLGALRTVDSDLQVREPKFAQTLQARLMLVF